MVWLASEMRLFIYRSFFYKLKGKNVILKLKNFLFVIYLKKTINKL